MVQNPDHCLIKLDVSVTSLGEVYVTFLLPVKCIFHLGFPSQDISSMLDYCQHVKLESIDREERYRSQTEGV